MALTTTPPRFQRSPHLVTLIAEVERLAAAVASVADADRAALAEETHRRAALASLRLDGTLLDGPPTTDELEAARTAAPTRPVAGRAGTWFDAMGITDDLTDGQAATLRALEYDRVHATLLADDLVPRLGDEPTGALRELHRRLTEGLVAPERLGAPRELEQAVHDAANGRVLFFAAPPERIASELALLDAWVRTSGAREHALITTGVLHLELLRIHPFDAANGRLARAAARLALRAKDLDPGGLAAPEIALADDPLGYHEEVARTLRRRDLTIWLERWAEAVSEGLRTAARELGGLPDRTPIRAARTVTELPAAFTVADHRVASGLDPAASGEELAALLDAGRIVRVAGTRGLRFRRTDAAMRRDEGVPTDVDAR